MPRVKRGLMVKKRHRKIKKQVKGFIHSRRASIKKAKEALLKAGQHSYRDRKRKKREFRQLWIIKLNAAVRQHGLKYSEFIAGLKKQKIQLNRKILVELATKEPEIFEEIIKKVKK